MAVNQCVEYYFNNGVEFPFGCKFDPTDEILVNSYLKLKIFNQPLPFRGIGQEVDVFQTEPWMLPYDRILSKHRKYYFFDIRNHRFQNMDTRPAGNGEWRTVEKNKELVLPCNSYIGRKNTLVYWKKQGNEVVKTKWMMHEFHIVSSAIYHPRKVSHLGAYRIFKIKAAEEAENEITTPEVNDFTIEDASSSSLPPSPTP
ncbi:hypothetical protein TSUD_407940 [Trifolium subterraneum]|uniref:NAC domain-containing protein n=1 Tax=Trifolium subterraneum TaxID=3900 RepID=A0A2Z6PSR7_TRISU|nr:hypothetical protein TSUD_407940 [Trifolium subterraneum]